MKRLITIVALLYCQWLFAQPHPIAFASANEFRDIRKQASRWSLSASALQLLHRDVDPLLDSHIDVPVPKDPAGGYTHDKHKTNYLLMYHAGMLYQLTGDKRYAVLVKKMLLNYAALNPTLKNHPQATSSSPGRLFWQALNDANWLVYAGLAMDLVHDHLSADERKHIANGAFKPLVDYFTKDKKDWFNLIHNHAVWACAGVGIVGIATDNPEYLDMALYGTEKDGKAGLLAQMDGLFSPDGFYHEGPYYTRYALLPFYLLANAVAHTRPQLNIFSYRNRILKKALDVALNNTHTDGTFYSYNDALKDKTYHTNEVVVALDIAAHYYGVDTSYLAVAAAQKRIVLHSGGLAMAKKLSASRNTYTFPYHSAEYADGAKGDQGGLSILRSGKADSLTSLIYKYTSHGLSHGHYDKLNIQLFDKGNEVLQDYGAVRYINIEHKWGGRYLPETNSFAQQTIAHNTLTVDETSHYLGDEKKSEANHPVRLFGDISDPALQVVCAMDDQASPGVSMMRSAYLITLDNAQKLVVDLFRVNASSNHQYDLPFYYLGTLMKTNFTYHTQEELQPLGKQNGYQHLWKEAESGNVGNFSQFTFLNNKTFYTISTLSDDSLSACMVRTGAHDPNFNLRHDPGVILRTRGSQRTFVSMIEPHGYFSPITEIAQNSYTGLEKMQLLQDDAQFTAVEIIYRDTKMVLVQANMNFSKKETHQFNSAGYQFSFKGPYHIFYTKK